MEVYFGNCFHSASRENSLVLLEACYVGVKNGIIVFVEEEGSKSLDSLMAKHEVRAESIFKLPKKGVALLLYSSHFLIPGMVDTHIHAPQYPNAGIGLDSSLMDWLSKYTYPLELKFTDLDLAKKCFEKVVISTLKNGTTTANYCGTIHVDATKVLVEACLKHGQRALIGNACKDTPNVDYSQTTIQSLKDAEELLLFVLSQNNSRIIPTISPRSAFGCTPDLLTQLGNMAKKYGARIHTHMNETKAEAEICRKSFPSSSTRAQIFQSSGLLTNKTILAHCVHMEESELEIVAEAGASVSHCPNSNISLRSGLASVRKLEKAGIKIGLGTDVSGGYNPSMLDAMRSGITTSKVLSILDLEPHPISYRDAFYYATLGGAQALGIGEVVGNFEVGKEFDALLLDLNWDLDEYEETFPLSPYQRIEKFIMLGDDRNISSVFVNGKSCLSNTRPRHSHLRVGNSSQKQASPVPTSPFSSLFNQDKVKLELEQ